MRVVLFVVLLIASSTPAAGQLVLEPVVHVSQDRPRVSHAEPHLSIHPADGRQLVAGVIALPDSGMAAVETLYSKDGGRTWQRLPLPRMDETWGADPWMAFDADNRPVAVALVGADGGGGPAVLWYYTADSVGAPWKDPIEIGLGTGGSWDHQRMVVDRTDGRYRNRAYVMGDKWGPRTVSGAATSGIGVSLIDDGSRITRIHHAHLSNTSKSASEGVVLRDGTLVFAFHEYLPLSQRSRERWIGTLWVTTSEDGGNTFSNRRYVANGLPPGQISLVADQRPGHERLYAFWGSGESVYSAWSDDRGHQWSPAATVGPRRGRVMMGTTGAVDGHGRVAVIWNNDVDGPDGQRCTQMRFGWSEPSDTLNFETRPLADATCVPLEGGPVFLVHEDAVETHLRYGEGGDYYGLVGLPDGGFVAMWVDASTGILQTMARRIVPQ